MRKITNPDFVLTVIEALTPHQSFASGANVPLLITGVDSKGNKGDYVVKFKNAQRMSSEANMRELLGLFIAVELDILCVEPVLINISQDFADILIGSPAEELAMRSLGLNFGSVYIAGPKTLLATEELNLHQLNHAQNIFAFDVLIQNPDRTVNKPNMLVDGNEIIIYDHEIAFSFVMDIFVNKQPWIIREIDMQWIGRHCLLAKIKGKAYDFQSFSNRLSALNEQFWNRARQLVPGEWRSEQFNTIKQYITAICNNKEPFINHLQQLMS